MNFITTIRRYVNYQSRPSWIRKFIAWYWVTISPIFLLIFTFIHIKSLEYEQLRKAFWGGNIKYSQVVISYLMSVIICFALFFWGFSIIKRKEAESLRLILSIILFITLFILFILITNQNIVASILFSLFTVLSIFELTRKNSMN